MAPGALIDEYSPQNIFPASVNRGKTKGIGPSCAFPATVDGGLVWTGSDFKAPNDYTLELSADQKIEIRKALDYFNDLGLDGDEITRENFPLPQLSTQLSECCDQIHNGRGFANIRGLNPNDFSIEENALLLLGISSYIGESRGKQDEDGNMMMHLYDVTETRAPQAVRPIRYSNRPSTFHTDTFCDILALQTRSNAASGGKHSLASAWTVYNELATTRPDIVHTLAEKNWHFDSRSQLVGSNCRPLLFHVDGRVVMNFAREPLLGVKGVSRDGSLPELTAQQFEALEMVEACASKHQLTLDLQPGDMTFVNNHAVLHTRESFQDDLNKKRHLVRLWLKNKTLAWKLPPELRQGNGRIYDDNEISEIWNIAPTPRLTFSLAERLCS